MNDSISIKKNACQRSRISLWFLIASMGLVAAACSAAGEDGALGDGAVAEDVDETTAALTGEIGPISEEWWKATGTCASGNTGITSARCAGRYCDDMYLFCSPTTRATAAYPDGAYWAVRSDGNAYVSEEPPWGGATGVGEFCDENRDGQIDGIMMGLRATGSYADNVNIQCTRLTTPLTTEPCFWTGWFSEENSTQFFPAGYFATGIRCSGRYCDNLSFLVCRM